IRIVCVRANAKCVISTTVGAEGISYQDGQDIILADTPEEWIKALTTLLKEPKRSETIAANGLELAHNTYGWEAITAQFLDFYREVMA
ncbi:MAG: glycosyltransferase, partial [Bacteroidota bacterium]